MLADANMHTEESATAVAIQSYVCNDMMGHSLVEGALQSKGAGAEGHLFVPWVFCSDLLQQGFVDNAQSHQGTVTMFLQQLFHVSTSQNESSAHVLKLPCSPSSGVRGEKSAFLQCVFPKQSISIMAKMRTDSSFFCCLTSKRQFQS